ncbi:hypothetical protein JCM7686_2020 [Paracoccus aminophilus JCM 7686]|uniref:Uncharacterized protein n=1 Tax=Paracoccus aminophilus JCM 7686 TaxID=1367847 RepID=S5XV59_PARAH|nr:hypothetical protein JCM7686_2020 [Paracoccus aminophilus JCM 7686]
MAAAWRTRPDPVSADVGGCESREERCRMTALDFIFYATRPPITLTALSEGFYERGQKNGRRYSTVSISIESEVEPYSLVSCVFPALSELYVRSPCGHGRAGSRAEFNDDIHESESACDPSPGPQYLRTSSQFDSSRVGEVVTEGYQSPLWMGRGSVRSRATFNATSAFGSFGGRGKGRQIATKGDNSPQERGAARRGSRTGIVGFSVTVLGRANHE